MDDLIKLIMFFIFLMLLNLILHLHDITQWIVLHKTPIILGSALIIFLAIIIFWWNYKRNKRIEEEEENRAKEREKKENEKRKIWRDEDIQQALNVGIRTIDSWHRQGLSTKEIGDLFEKRMAVHFRLEYYKVQEVGHSGDGGVDLILGTDEGKKIIVQCKCKKYPSQKVNPTEISRTDAAKRLKNADESWIITDSVLTKQAEKEAQVLGVVVWDRSKLMWELDKKRNEVKNFINRNNIVV